MVLDTFKNIGFAYLPKKCIKNKIRLVVEVFGEMIPVKIAPDITTLKAVVSSQNQGAQT